MITARIYAETEEGDEIAYDVEGTVEPARRGRYSGPPELCYPDEGGEVEVMSAWRVEGEGQREKRVQVDVGEVIEAVGQDRVSEALAEAVADEYECAKEYAAEARAEARAERWMDD